MPYSKIKDVVTDQELAVIHKLFFYGPQPESSMEDVHSVAVLMTEGLVRENMGEVGLTAYGYGFCRTHMFALLAGGRVQNQHLRTRLNQAMRGLSPSTHKDAYKLLTELRAGAIPGYTLLPDFPTPEMVKALARNLEEFEVDEETASKAYQAAVEAYRTFGDLNR